MVVWRVTEDRVKPCAGPDPAWIVGKGYQARPANRAPMEPFRSLLFVPASEGEWVRTAGSRYDADGVIVDLEDAVAPEPGAKRAARERLLENLDGLAGSEALALVRVNGPATPFFDADLDAVVRPGVDAVVLPDLASPEEVRRAADVIGHLEAVRGLDEPIELVALPETAPGLNDVAGLCAASDRVSVAVGSTGADGDTQRAIGYEFTPGARERLYLLSRVVMDARAAGVDQLVAGVWTDIDDLDGLRREAELSRQLGYTGMMVIHPSHLEPVNEAFTPDSERVDRARRLLEAYEAEEAAVVRFEGSMVDAAHAETARRLIGRAEALDG